MPRDDLNRRPVRDQLRERSIIFVYLSERNLCRIKK